MSRTAAVAFVCLAFSAPGAAQERRPSHLETIDVTVANVEVIVTARSNDLAAAFHEGSPRTASTWTCGRGR